MNGLLGTSLGVFIGLHVILVGGAGFMTGVSIASTWRPARQVVFYSLLLAAVARFLTYALFDGELLSITGYIVDALVIGGIAMFAYALTRARKMVGQYPWLYRRTGPIGFAPIDGTARGEKSD